VPDALPDLALYVHWPYCSRICPYCDFNVVRARGREAEAKALAEVIVCDIQAQAQRIGPRRLVSIFFGGGTPSLMDPAALGRIVATAKDLFDPAPELEITLEANPTDAEAERFRSFAEAGVQRLSLGVQSLDDAALKFLGRNHDAAEAERAARAAADAFARLSIDLIYARPGQSLEDWRRELSQALAWGPEHVSPYQLTIEPTTAFGRAAARGQLRPPDEDLAADLYDTTQAVLEGAGFEAYEVSNHARGEAARSRHNLAIWRGAEYLGAGPGAHGRIVLDGARTATIGARGITDYLARVEKTGTGFETADALSRRDAAEERVLLGLRIGEGVPLSALGALDLDTSAPPVSELLEAGFLRIDRDRIAATPAGRLVLDRVIAELLTA
jgi:oxygen-independent coproporphyrinogen-3 oxidase